MQKHAASFERLEEDLEIGPIRSIEVEHDRRMVTLVTDDETPHGMTVNECATVPGLDWWHLAKRSSDGVPVSVRLPTQGRRERAHLYRWIAGEEAYVAGKFDDQRHGHDESLRQHGMDSEGFWLRQVVQYYDRARMFFDAAREIETDGTGVGPDEYNSLRKRTLELKGQQALVKAMMTAKGCAESSVRVFGPLPAPGHPSGFVYGWDEV